METKKFEVKGMSCDHCVHAIEGALGKLEGVTHSKVDLNEESVNVVFEPDDVSVETLVETIEDQGYDVVR